ncbi:hypothetical protein E4K10_03355 [Streptomyces sp. T1317-0309]|nr:hypothetical protein E4K10_03355 [Streptomyces sp. T1317-0309]
MLGALDYRGGRAASPASRSPTGTRRHRFTEQQDRPMPWDIPSGRRSGEDRAAEDGDGRLEDVRGSARIRHPHYRSATAGARPAVRVRPQ